MIRLNNKCLWENVGVGADVWNKEQTIVLVCPASEDLIRLFSIHMYWLPEREATIWRAE